VRTDDDPEELERQARELVRRAEESRRIKAERAEREATRIRAEQEAGEQEEAEAEGKSKDQGPRPTPLLYNVADACFILGKISKQMLYRLIHLKLIFPVKIGTRSLFTMEELQRFVDERVQESYGERLAVVAKPREQKAQQSAAVEDSRPEVKLPPKGKLSPKDKVYDQVTELIEKKEFENLSGLLVSQMLVTAEDRRKALMRWYRSYPR
jgi:hypothetical protein